MTTTTELVLPRQAIILEDSRDQLVIELDAPYDSPHAQRTVILWPGPYRDERLSDVYTAITHRDNNLRATLLGLSARDGAINAWFSPFDKDTSRVRGRLQACADAALRPRDRWRVNPVQLCECDADGRLDVAKLPEGHALLKAATVHGLGTVRTS